MPIAKYVAGGAMGFALGIGFLGHAPQLEPPQGQAGADKLTAASLKTMVDGLGYESKVLNADAGKEKYEISMKTDKLNIPVGAEVSPSGNYIWLTVFLGENKATKPHEELLKSNGSVQPTFFYITSKGNLMAAMAMDNRAITAPIMKRCLDKLVSDVDKTADVWQK